MAGFLEAVSPRNEAQIVCEPRNAIWFLPGANALLAERQVARAAADPAKVPEAGLPVSWRGLNYLRLHGSTASSSASFTCQWHSTPRPAARLQTRMAQDVRQARRDATRERLAERALGRL